MPLLSIEFAVFFIVFLPLYWAFARLPQVQNVLLLVAGLGWLYRIDPIFAALILVYSSVVYLVSVLMFSENENIRKFWLGCGISAALTVLCFFKYFDFFRPIIQQYTGQSAVIDILLPLGLSYYTFQSLAYLVYCYREPKGDRFEWHELLLHLSFFPTITSGPIIRAAAFKSIDGEQAGALAQIRTKQARQLIYPALAVGLIVLGIAKNGGLPAYWRKAGYRLFLKIRPSSMAGACCLRFMATPSNSFSTFPATRIWSSVWPCCSASSCRKTLPRRFAPSTSATSGIDGISACPLGFATISISLWAAAKKASDAPSSI